MESFTNRRNGDTIGFTFAAELGAYHGRAAGSVNYGRNGFNAICSHNHATIIAAKTCAGKMAKVARADIEAYHGVRAAA